MQLIDGFSDRKHTAITGNCNEKVDFNKNFSPIERRGKYADSKKCNPYDGFFK